MAALRESSVRMAARPCGVAAFGFRPEAERPCLCDAPRFRPRLPGVWTDRRLVDGGSTLKARREGVRCPRVDVWGVAPPLSGAEAMLLLTVRMRPTYDHKP